MADQTHIPLLPTSGEKPEMVWSQRHRLRHSQFFALPIKSDPYSLSHKKLQKELHAANHHWQQTVDALLDPVCVVDNNGLVLNGNQAFINFLPTLSHETRLDQLVPGLPLSCLSQDIRIGDRWYHFDRKTIAQSASLCIFRDITAYRILEGELLRTKQLAESASESKSTFLANMSHEIRTPLGAMLGFARLLKDDGVSAKDRLQFIDTIIHNGINLTLLVDDILDLSRVEAEKMEFEHRCVDIYSLLEDVKSSLKPAAENKSLALSSEWAEGTPHFILSDGARIRQIMINIVGNALKFTSNGKVHIAVHSGDNQEVHFEVNDTGRGISPEFQDHLFQYFSQGDNSTTRRYGGTGLGLILSRQLAKGLGGNVELLSSKPGSGSTFLVRLRAEPAPKEPKPLAKSDASVRPLEGLRVLIADDSPDNRLLLKRILTRQGIVVADVENGLEAVRLAHEYDLVLMDIQMPILDGYYATARLRAAGYQGAIIALTAHAMKEERERCLAIGCSEYLTKPIDVQLLLKTIALNAVNQKVRMLH